MDRRSVIGGTIRSQTEFGNEITSSEGMASPNVTSFPISDWERSKAEAPLHKWIEGTSLANSFPNGVWERDKTACPAAAGEFGN